MFFGIKRKIFKCLWYKVYIKKIYIIYLDVLVFDIFRFIVIQSIDIKNVKEFYYFKNNIILCFYFNLLF